MMMPLRAWLLACLGTLAILTANAQEAELPASARAAEDGFLADELRRVDASEDDWDSEVFYDEIKPLIKRWVAPMAARTWDADIVEEISPQIKVAPLRPAPFNEMRLAGGFVLRRPSAPLSQTPEIAALQQAVNDWLSPFAPKQPVDIHIKVFRVDMQGNNGLSGVYVDVTGPAAAQGTVQQNGTWKITWSRSSATAPWQMDSLVLAEFEELHALAEEPLFSDVTMAALGRTEAWTEQLRYGIDHWRLRLETSLSIEPGGINGMALGDVNGDGLEDLFYTDSGGLPKRLFLHQPDGRRPSQTSLSSSARWQPNRCDERSRARFFGSQPGGFICRSR